MPLTALPKAWSPGTRKPVRGAVEAVTIDGVEDLEPLAGKVKGKILLIGEARPLRPADQPPHHRYSEEELDALLAFEIPDSGRGGFNLERRRKRLIERREAQRFFAAEGVLATIEASSRGAGIVRLGGTGAYHQDDPGVPALVMAAEHYNLLLRLVERDEPVELEIEVEARFHDDGAGFNTIAEIPGSGDGVVMAGAHLDSWHPGAGATDNGAACAVVMEAMRILAALEVNPRRTIRLALWSGEEQGLLGSRGYVAEHFASRPVSDDPEQARFFPHLRDPTGPLELKPEHATLSAYFNLDNGSGKIRGVWAQENAAVKPIFEAWLAPFADLGADTVTLRRTGGTDHLPFDRVGLPGFQFIQDGLEYFTRTHHSHLDLLDYVQEEDLKQASVILASFLYHAAMRDEPLPRKPMPREEPAREAEAAGEHAGEGPTDRGDEGG